jgi:acetolactate decarboxylase
MGVNKTFVLLAFITGIHFISPCLYAQVNKNDQSVKITGAMRNVMWQGQLGGVIDIDTISVKDHLYGLGPVEYLTGEILIADGKAYKSVVTGDSTMQVEETFNIRSPFFVYANVNRWRELAMPDSIQTLEQLETFIHSATKRNSAAFAFRLTGEAESASIHIVNLPKGSKVSSPEDAHLGLVDYQLKNEQVTLIGFFSTQHKGIFTHHDRFVHIHLLAAGNSKMGHLEEIILRKGSAKLYLPEE